VIIALIEELLLFIIMYLGIQALVWMLAKSVGYHSLTTNWAMEWITFLLKRTQDMRQTMLHWGSL